MRVIIYALDTAVRSLSLFSAIQSMIHEFLKPSIGAWKRDSGTGWSPLPDLDFLLSCSTDLRSRLRRNKDSRDPKVSEEQEIEKSKVTLSF